MAFNLKTKLWMTGALEWWGMIGNKDVYLGTREFPNPPEEGDEWTVRKTRERFKIVDGEVCRLGRDDTPLEPWEVP